MMRRIDLRSLDEAGRRDLLRRSPVPSTDVRKGAARIVAEVRRGGDAALDAAAARYGGGRSGARRVSREELEDALASLAPELVAAMERAAGNIRRFHEAQLPEATTLEVEPGVTVERRWTPLRRVGAYVPGGAAAYPSNVLMTVIPARVAGVGDVVVASPAAADGSVSPALLGAAALTGADEVHVMGGAQAIAALAYGTETIRPVQKIVGPGNAWVTAAKLALVGDCAIDMPAGPSEVVVVADGTSDPYHVASDLLCQAEHGPDSPAVLVTADEGVLDAVAAAVGELLPRLERADILAKALTDHGWLVLAPDHGAALRFADDYAPEHLSVATADPARDAAAVPNAGSVYVGEWSPEPVGDYASGANHVLPTGGTAAVLNPLGVEDFGSWRQVQTLTREGLEALRPAITELATAEGLTAHRLAVDIRFEDGR
jgi:histidinol dehydrogenase